MVAVNETDTKLSTTGSIQQREAAKKRAIFVGLSF